MSEYDGSHGAEAVAEIIAVKREACALLRDVSAANADDDGGHEDVWDAVDEFVSRLGAPAGLAKCPPHDFDLLRQCRRCGLGGVPRVGVSADIIRALRVEIADALAERARARTTFDAAPRSDTLSAEGYHRADAYWLGLGRALEIAEALRDRGGR